jgi:Ser/Thr protein kinase RdoA (MazF antagonist)
VTGEPTAGFEELPADVRAAIDEAYDLRLRVTIDHRAGEETAGWQCEIEGGASVFVQHYPTWRSTAEIAWVHARLQAIAATVPEAIVPLAASDGRTVLGTGGGPVVVFPFVDGAPLDDADENLRLGAARLLARIHAAGLRTPASPRPPSHPGAPSFRRPPVDLPPMVDPELDVWERSLDDGSFLRGLIHGDVYGRNVLCRDGTVVGVIDWMEMDRAPLVLELGWTIWEFSQNDDGDDLDIRRARSFLATYRAAGGPVRPEENGHLVPAIRRRLRSEVRSSFAADAVRDGPPEPNAYREAEIRAFPRLADVTFP